jgi:hypothetical protein
VSQIPRHRRVTVSVLAAWALAAAPAFAQGPTLTLALHLSAPAGTGTVGADLTAGLAPGAGPGYDPGLDSRAYRLGALQAAFVNPALPEKAQRLMHDFRADTGEQTWTLEVTTPAAPLGEAVPGSGTVTIAWEPPATSGGTCGGRTLTLVDVDGGGAAIDMTAAPSYTLPAPGPDGVHTLELVVGAPGSLSEGALAPPARVFSPLQGRRGVLLVWSPAPGSAAGYHVERTDTPGDPAAVFTRLTASPVREARYVDADAVGKGAVGYRVVAVSGSGCESAPSETVVVTP